MLGAALGAVFMGLVLGLSATTPAATLVYEHESEAAFDQQIAGNQIAAATINKRLATVRVTLKDGRYVLGKYGKGQEPTVLAELTAKRVPVSVLTPAQALVEAKHPVHHKLRYIAGGILLVVIIVVASVLLVNRRRQRD